jgi:hypothetical protein
MDNFFEVEGLGPVDHLRITLPADDPGGVTIVRGDNQLGKSTVLVAVDALLTGDASMLEPSRDGAGVGFVRGPARELKITARGARRKGGSSDEPQRALAGADLCTFMDPGFESEDSNDRARIRELAALTGARLTLEDFGGLVEGGAETLRAMGDEKDLETDDPVELADRVKRLLDKAAREQGEKEVARLTVECEAIERATATVDTAVETDPATLQGRVREAVRAIETAREQQRALSAAIDAQLRARGSLQTFRERSTGPSVADAARRVAAADQDAAEAHDAADAAAARRVEAEALLRDARAAYDSACEVNTRARQGLGAARDILAAAEAAAAAASEWEATVERPLPAAPDAAALAALADDEQAALAAQAAGVAARAAQAALQRLAALQDARDKAKKTAQAWRDAAASVDDVLSEVVRRTGVPGLKVTAGRLVCQNVAGWLPMAKLSGSARAEVARDIWLEAAARMAEPGKPAPRVVLRQEAWDGMASAARARTIQRALQRGVRIITAEKWDGPLEAVEAQEATYA